jgi:hypothetical protein
LFGIRSNTREHLGFLEQCINFADSLLETFDGFQAERYNVTHGFLLVLF